MPAMGTNETAARAIVITGASTGIGRACALHLDGLGFRVFAGVRKEADGEALRREASDRLTPLMLDVTDAASIAAAAETVAEATGGNGLAGLVNNAGIGVAGPLEVLPIADLRRQFEVNVIGQVAVTQAFLPLLRRAGGPVVNIGSSGGRVTKPFIGAYCASKFALEALTGSLRLELHPWDIRVVMIEPGPVATPIWGKSMAATEALIERLPQAARDLYMPVVAAARAVLEARGTAVGMPAETVARAVARALTARRPKRRYLVGRIARFQAVCVWLLPACAIDWLIRRKLRVPKAV